MKTLSGRIIARFIEDEKEQAKFLFDYVNTSKKKPASFDKRHFRVENVKKMFGNEREYNKFLETYHENRQTRGFVVSEQAKRAANDFLRGIPASRAARDNGVSIPTVYRAASYIYRETVSN